MHIFLCLYVSFIQGGKQLLIEVLGLIGLILLGLLIILIIKLLFMLVPAAIVAVVVWLLTGSTWLAGIAFLIVAALSILKIL